MNSFRLRLMAQVLPFLLAVPAAVCAQPVQPPTPAEAAAALNPAGAPLSQAQLDQLLAPIALYPDQLLMQLLMASTFPQQVVDAGQWLQNPANAGLAGDALVAALQPLPWDPSVKSLVAFPQIIAMMNMHLDWTEALGGAFGSQQVATMADVQSLRNRAIAARQLVSNAQITVVRQGAVIVINPTSPGMLYVPIYNPALVYGTWPYADYPPVYIPPPPGFVPAGFALGPGLGFSVGFGILAPLWGWGHPDWGRGAIVVDPAHYGRITTQTNINGNHIAIQGGTWRRTAPVIRVVPASVPRPAALPPGPRPPGTIDPAGIRPPGSGRPPIATPGEPRPAVVRPAAPTPPNEPRPAVVRPPAPNVPNEPRPAVVRPPTPTPPNEPRPAVIRPPAPTPPNEPRPAAIRPPAPNAPAEPRPAVVRPPAPRPPNEPRPAVIRPPAPTPPAEPRPAVIRPPAPTPPAEPRPAVVRPPAPRPPPAKAPEKKEEPGN